MSYPGGPAGPHQPSYPNGTHDTTAGPPGQPPFHATPPVSGPPERGPYPAPYSGAGAYAPAPGGFGSAAPPNSGAGAYAPAPGGFGSAAPPDGGPGPAGAGTVAGRRRRATVPLLASLLVVFVLATAVLAALYGSKNSDYNDQKKAADRRQEQVTKTSADLKKVQEELAKVQGELSTAKRDIATTQARVDELNRQKNVLWSCLQLLNEAAQAQIAGNTALADQKRTEGLPVCKEALAIPR